MYVRGKTRIKTHRHKNILV